MSDNRQLIWLIRNRYELDDKDFERYFNKMNQLIEQTIKSLNIKYDMFEIMDCKSIITQDEFVNLCWDTVEGKDDNDKKLIDFLNTLEFPDDNRLISYIKKAFENLFLDYLNIKNPGFQTRKKQVSRVMNPLCIKTRGKKSADKGDLWLLKGYDTQIANTVEFEQLKELASQIAMPDITYPKSEDSKRGASIKDKDMKNYMLYIFRAAGGAVYEKELDKLIAYLFGLDQMNSSISEFSSYKKGGDSGDSDDYQALFDNIPISTDLVMAPSCYTIMAQQCIDSMDEDIKEILYFSYVQDLDLETIGTKIGKSISGVSKMRQKAEKHIFDYIKNSPSDFSREEAEIIIKLIEELISEQRQVL